MLVPDGSTTDHSSSQQGNWLLDVRRAYRFSRLDANPGGLLCWKSYHSVGDNHRANSAEQQLESTNLGLVGRIGNDGGIHLLRVFYHLYLSFAGMFL